MEPFVVEEDMMFLHVQLQGLAGSLGGILPHCKVEDSRVRLWREMNLARSRHRGLVSDMIVL